ncbi:MAG: hypothetical protein ABR962_03630 [Candidatus Bathyarchaeia archaeon]
MTGLPSASARDRAHFTVSVDPMRVVTVPNTVNGKTGLICTFIGSPRDLERTGHFQSVRLV